MRVISKRRLREFWERHPQAESPLLGWHRVAEHADWRCIADVRATYANGADVVGEWTVFDIAGNNYRLVVRIESELGTIFVDRPMTHAEYDHWTRKQRHGR